MQYNYQPPLRSVHALDPPHRQIRIRQPIPVWTDLLSLRISCLGGRYEAPELHALDYPLKLFILRLLRYSRSYLVPYSSLAISIKCNIINHDDLSS